MQSRMDKYKLGESTPVKSRLQKNKELYEKIKQSDITDFDVSSNISIIENNASKINVEKVKEFLNERYGDNTPKRKSIDLPKEKEIEPQETQELIDTKEYDINAILEKAKKGKNIDYSKERLKKVREAQFEILNNLDEEMQKVSNKENFEQEKKENDVENLKNLINTITALELKNKEEKETKTDLDLLGLSDGDEEDKNNENDLEDNNDIEEQDDTKPDVIIGNPSKEETNSINKINLIEPEEKKENELEDTLHKLKIDSYDDFSDVSKSDVGSILLKIIIFIIFILLLIGILYILNNLLGLGLFNF